MSSTISPPQTTKASSAAILLVAAAGWKEVILHTEPALRNGFLHVLGLLLDSSHRLAHLGIVQLRKLEVALPLLRSLNL